MQVPGQSGRKPNRNRRHQYTFRNWMQCLFLLFLSVVIACIAMKAFQDFVKGRVEMRKRDLLHIDSLRLALPVD